MEEEVLDISLPPIRWRDQISLGAAASWRRTRRHVPQERSARIFLRRVTVAVGGPIDDAAENVKRSRK
jgi:hypothetical protein